MPRKFIFAAFFLLAAAGLLDFVTLSAGTGPQDVYSGNSPGDSRRGRNPARGEPEDCTCRGGGEQRRLLDEEVARSQRIFGEISRREDEENRRYWKEYNLMWAKAARVGKRCETCEGAVEPVKKTHERNWDALSAIRRQCGDAAQCRMGWIRGGCCGPRPPCFSGDCFKLGEDPDAARARAEAQVEDAVRQAEEIYRSQNVEGPRRGAPRRDPLGFPSAEAGELEREKEDLRIRPPEGWRAREKKRLLDYHYDKGSSSYRRGEPLPNLLNGGIEVLDRGTPRFNCYGYAADPDSPPGWVAVGADEIAPGVRPADIISLSGGRDLVDFFGRYGWEPRKDGVFRPGTPAPPRGTELIILWATNPGQPNKEGVKHAGIWRHDGLYAKMGDLGTFRFDRPEQLNGGYFGEAWYVLQRRR